ncbi:MAG: electron transport complex subunit RsxG [Gammaproteobacteria bacterium]|jgi:electron transport complex protein RnfG|nr:electron transport complex subunit RsxG [Gammaproteobacteria bacterium]
MTENTESGLWQNIRNNALNLGLIAILAAAALAAVYVATKPSIIANQRAAQLAALTQVMPTEYFDEELLKHPITLPAPEQLNLEPATIAYAAMLKGQLNGWVLPVISLDGYSGRIHMLVGIDIHGQVTGVRITSHKETPGLGDKVDYQKSTWVDGFIGSSLSSHRWAVKKDQGDFDQFTGATITPRAVVQAVQSSLIYYKQYQDELLAALNTNVNIASAEDE